MEDRFEKSLAYRNKNPLNIRDNGTKWQGWQGREKGFVIFSSFSMGYRAAVKILRSYHLRGIKTIGGIIRTWAPSQENDTEKYLRVVLEYMNGVFRTPSQGGLEDYTAESVINLKDREEVKNLLLAMSKVEMGATTAAQQHFLRHYAYIGYDMAVTTNGFFNGIKY